MFVELISEINKLWLWARCFSGLLKVHSEGVGPAQL